MATTRYLELPTASPEEPKFFDPTDQAVFERIEAAVRAALSEQEIAAAWASASALESAALLGSLLAGERLRPAGLE